MRGFYIIMRAGVKGLFSVTLQVYMKNHNQQQKTSPVQLIFFLLFFFFFATVYRFSGCISSIDSQITQHKL